MGQGASEPMKDMNSEGSTNSIGFHSIVLLNVNLNISQQLHQDRLTPDELH